MIQPTGQPLTFGSLFAGIGGFDLGFERAGMVCKWQVEIDNDCRNYLSGRWPNVKQHDDVRTWKSPEADPVDVVCGGFPCQDISNAGFRHGIDGERSGLWSEIARIAGDIRPRFVVVENVSALLGRGMGRVLGDLASLGYDAEWECLPASAFGAHHRRDRIFIIAYRPDSVCLRPQRQWPPAKGPWSREQFERLVQADLRISVPAGTSGGISDGVRNRKHRLHALGNSIVPQVAEWIGRRVIELAK